MNKLIGFTFLLVLTLAQPEAFAQTQKLLATGLKSPTLNNEVSVAAPEAKGGNYVDCSCRAHLDGTSVLLKNYGVVSKVLAPPSGWGYGTTTNWNDQGTVQQCHQACYNAAHPDYLSQSLADLACTSNGPNKSVYLQIEYNTISGWLPVAVNGALSTGFLGYIYYDANHGCPSGSIRTGNSCIQTSGSSPQCPSGSSLVTVNGGLQCKAEKAGSQNTTCGLFANQ